MASLSGALWPSAWASFDVESAVSEDAVRWGAASDAISDLAGADAEFAPAVSEAAPDVAAEAVDIGFSVFCAGAVFDAAVTPPRGAVSEAADPLGGFPAAGPGFCGSAATSKGLRPPDPGFDAKLLGDCTGRGSGGCATGRR
jgi:hypothetical protein